MLELAASRKRLPTMSAEGERSVIAQFVTEDGEKGDIPEVYLPADVTPVQLAEAINQLLKNEEEVPYAFYVNDTEVTGTLDAVMAGSAISSETVVPIVYTPQAVFRVRSVTRCTSSLPGKCARSNCPTFAAELHLARAAAARARCAAATCALANECRLRAADACAQDTRLPFSRSSSARTGPSWRRRAATRRCVCGT